MILEDSKVTWALGYFEIKFAAARRKNPLLLSQYCQYAHSRSQQVSVLRSPSMLTSLASRSFRRNVLRNAHPNSQRPLRVPTSTLPVLIATGYAPVRNYSQTPPGGTGGVGGIPGFRFPMQQQHSKGDALKEFVRALPRIFCGRHI